MATKFIAKHQIALRRLYLNDGPCKAISNVIGTTKEEFIKYINSQLINGMTVENFGKVWGLDHIVPTELFNQDDPNEFKLCWNFNNIMPMFIHDNRKKGASVHFSIEKLNKVKSNECVEKLKLICENEIKNTWNKYL